MIIEDARVTLLRLPYRELPRFQAGYQRDREILLLELETRDGIVLEDMQLLDDIWLDGPVVEHGTLSAPSARDMACASAPISCVMRSSVIEA